jgi:hypothetical protein
MHRKMRDTFDILEENKLITLEEKTVWLDRCQVLYKEWHLAMRLARKPTGKKRGRPQTNIPRNSVHPNCKRPGCARPSAPEQVYCSPDCAPLGRFRGK